MSSTAIRVPLEAVESSNLKAFGWDPERQILAIQFKTRSKILHYAGVGLDVMTRFVAAPSKGKFYAEEIRGKFQGQQMTGDCPDCGDHGWSGDRCEECGCSDYAPAPPYEPKARTLRRRSA